MIMPTGMITMHTDPNLASESSKTAKNGKKVLSALKAISPQHEESIVKISRAVHAVATESDSKDCDEEQFQVCRKYFQEQSGKTCLYFSLTILFFIFEIPTVLDEVF